MRRSDLCWLVFAFAIGHASAAQPGAVSVSGSPGVSAAGSSFAPQLSRDGRSVVFTCHGKNLTKNSDLSPHLNVFRKDLTSGAIELISTSADGSSGSRGNSAFYSVSSNGQFVAFASAGDNLIDRKSVV